MASLKSLIAAVAACALPAAANATVTYTLTLTDATNPTYSGTGTLTLDAAPSTTGQTDYFGAQVSELSFTIAGQTFSLAGGGVYSIVRFVNGALNDITFAQEIGASPNRYSLQTTAGYVFYYNNELSPAYGTMTAALSAPTPAASDVPEPASWALMLGGFGIIGAIMRRGRRTTVSFG